MSNEYKIPTIPEDFAIRAFDAISFRPEQRGRAAVEEFRQAMEEDKKHFSNAEEFNRYAEKAHRLYMDYLSKKSRTMSAMITGPARFPTEANRKRIDSEMRAWDKFSALRKKIADRNRPKPGNGIHTGEAGAAEKLEEKIKKAEKLQEQMKAANIIIRKKNMTDEEKVNELCQLFGTNDRGGVAALLEPDFMGRVGFADYQLKNNNANIRRLKQQLAKAENLADVAEQEPVIKFDGGEIVRNIEAGRLQIIFDEKPGEEMRGKLKKRGFRWSPKYGAWQRQLTANAVIAAKQIVGVSA